MIDTKLHVTGHCEMGMAIHKCHYCDIKHVSDYEFVLMNIPQLELIFPIDTEHE